METNPHPPDELRHEDDEVRRDDPRETPGRYNGTSTGRQVSDLISELGTLVRQEVQLAKAEVSEQAREAKGAAAKIGTGSAVLHAGALTLAAMFVVGLTLLFRSGMEPLEAGFLATLIVGVVLAIVGFALVKNGVRHLSPSNFVPRKALESVRQDFRWAKGQL